MAVPFTTQKVLFLSLFTQHPAGTNTSLYPARTPHCAHCTQQEHLTVPSRNTLVGNEFFGLFASGDSVHHGKEGLIEQLSSSQMYMVNALHVRSGCRHLQAPVASLLH